MNKYTAMGEMGLLLTIMILIFSCQNEISEYNDSNSVKIQFTDIDTIQVQIDSGLISQHWNAHFIESDTGIIYIGIKKEVIDFYNLSSQNHITSIKLIKEGPYANYGEFAHFHNWDSIFICHRFYPLELYLIDSTGAVNNRWNIR